MGSTAESINLTVMKRIDPCVTELILTAGHCAAYILEKNQSWRKLDIEGSLFVVHRSTLPEYRLILMNRLNPTNLITDLVPGMQVESSVDFLMIKCPTTTEIYNFWFYNSKEQGIFVQLLKRISSSADVSDFRERSTTRADGLPSSPLLTPSLSTPNTPGRTTGKPPVTPPRGQNRRDSTNGNVPTNHGSASNQDKYKKAQARKSSVDNTSTPPKPQQNKTQQQNQTTSNSSQSATSNKPPGQPGTQGKADTTVPLQSKSTITSTSVPSAVIEAQSMGGERLVSREMLPHEFFSQMKSLEQDPDWSLRSPAKILQRSSPLLQALPIPSEPTSRMLFSTEPEGSTAVQSGNNETSDSVAKFFRTFENLNMQDPSSNVILSSAKSPYMPAYSPAHHSQDPSPMSSPIPGSPHPPPGFSSATLVNAPSMPPPPSAFKPVPSPSAPTASASSPSPPSWSSSNQQSQLQRSSGSADQTMLSFLMQGTGGSWTNSAVASGNGPSITSSVIPGVSNNHHHKVPPVPRKPTDPTCAPSSSPDMTSPSTTAPFVTPSTLMNMVNTDRKAGPSSCQNVTAKLQDSLCTPSGTVKPSTSGSTAPTASAMQLPVFTSSVGAGEPLPAIVTPALLQRVSSANSLSSASPSPSPSPPPSDLPKSRPPAGSSPTGTVSTTSALSSPSQAQAHQTQKAQGGISPPSRSPDSSTNTSLSTYQKSLAEKKKDRERELGKDIRQATSPNSSPPAAVSHSLQPTSPNGTTDQSTRGQQGSHNKNRTQSQTSPNQNQNQVVSAPATSHSTHQNGTAGVAAASPAPTKPSADLLTSTELNQLLSLMISQPDFVSEFYRMYTENPQGVFAWLRTPPKKAAQTLGALFNK